jgi:hypothetical protein
MLICQNTVQPEIVPECIAALETSLPCFQQQNQATLVLVAAREM